MMPEQSRDFRAGFVAIAGLPNTGKSTLLNALCGTRLSIVSPKPQTTRNNILAMLNGPGYQAVFVDTPGLLTARTLFEKSMVNSIKRAAREESDVAVVLAEPVLPSQDKMSYFEGFRDVRCPLYLAINKMDLYSMNASEPERTAKTLAGIFPIKEMLFISAMGGLGIKELKTRLLAELPIHPPYYPQDQLTDRWERFYASEIIREQIFHLYSEEIPYSSAVAIEVFRETPGLPDYILAAVHISKPTHKPIIIGKGGRMIKDLREKAQAALEKFLRRKVKLELVVKVTKDWQNNPQFLKELGFYEKGPQ